MTLQRISFDPSYFAKVLKDYSNWKMAWGREAGQNSLDAGASRIDVTIEEIGDETIVIWADNGCGMTRDIILGKFMAVGGSQKANGNTGGFGIAKLILAFAHKRYEILTLTNKVEGSNDSFSISELPDSYPGCLLRVVMDGNYKQELENNFIYWTRFTTAPGVTFRLNGIACEFLPADKVEPLSEQDWCRLSKVSESVGYYHHGIFVRINGQFMFHYWSSVNAAVLVELEGNSLSFLTSNRDGLQYPHGSNLSKIVEQIFKDPTALFDIEEDIIEFWQGSNGPVIGENTTRQNAAIRRVAQPTAIMIDGEIAASTQSHVSNPYACQSIASLKAPDMVKARPSILQDRHDMVILNKTNKAVPDNWQPGNMKRYGWSVFDRWTRVVRTVAEILGIKSTIRTGWIFSTSAVAAHKRNKDYGHLILLNPCVVNDNDWDNAGYNSSRESFYSLVSSAVHELTHIEHYYHDEQFTIALTDNMAKVFANMSEINKVK